MLVRLLRQEMDCAAAKPTCPANVLQVGLEPPYTHLRQDSCVELPVLWSQLHAGGSGWGGEDVRAAHPRGVREQARGGARVAAGGGSRHSRDGVRVGANANSVVAHADHNLLQVASIRVRPAKQREGSTGARVSNARQRSSLAARACEHHTPCKPPLGAWTHAPFRSASAERTC